MGGMIEGVRAAEAEGDHLGDLAPDRRRGSTILGATGVEDDASDALAQSQAATRHVDKQHSSWSQGKGGLWCIAVQTRASDHECRSKPGFVNSCSLFTYMRDSASGVCETEK